MADCHQTLVKSSIMNRVSCLRPRGAANDALQIYDGFPDRKAFLINYSILHLFVSDALLSVTPVSVCSVAGQRCSVLLLQLKLSSINSTPCC